MPVQPILMPARTRTKKFNKTIWYIIEFLLFIGLLAFIVLNYHFQFIS